MTQFLICHPEFTAFYRLNQRNYRRSENFYEQIAELMFEIITYAAEIKSPTSRCWSIHYISIWDTFFCTFHQTNAWKMVRHKLCRLIYKKVCHMNKFPDYQAAKVLGFCLNIMGLEVQKDKIYFSLHKLLLKWMRINYSKLISDHPFVAESCLVGSISLDKENQLLIKTWENSSSEPHQQFLNY